MTPEAQAGVPMAFGDALLPEEATTTTPAATALLAAWATGSKSQLPMKRPPPRLMLMTSAFTATQVVNAGDHAPGGSGSTSTQDLDTNQGGLWRHPLKGLRSIAAAKIYRQPGSAHGDARHVGTMAIVIFGVVIAVDNVDTCGRVNPVRVHDVVRIYARIDDADARARAIRCQTRSRNLTLQGLNQRCAVVQVGLDHHILMNAHHTSNLLQGKKRRLRDCPGFS